MKIRRNVKSITLRKGEYAANLQPRTCLDVIISLTNPLPDKTEQVVVKLPVYPYSSSKVFELPQTQKKIKALFGNFQVIDEQDIPTLKPHLKEVVLKRNKTGWYISF